MNRKISPSTALLLALALLPIQALAFPLASPLEAGEIPEIVETHSIIGGIVGDLYGRKLSCNGRRAAAGTFTATHMLFRQSSNQWLGLEFLNSASVSALDSHQFAYQLPTGTEVRGWTDGSAQSDPGVLFPALGPADSLAISDNLLALGVVIDREINVYRWNGAQWHLDFHQQNPFPLSSLGTSVDLDGSRLAFSDPNFGNGLTGEVFLRARNPLGIWFDFGTIRAPGEEVENGFGASLSLSGDWLAVGAPFEDTIFGTDMGAIYLYKADAVGFFQLRTLLFGTQSGARFGSSVELDGHTLIVGAPKEDTHHPARVDVARGAAYVYWRSGDDWDQVARLSALNGFEGDELGTSVCIGGDSVLAGAPRFGVLEPGGVFVYQGLVAPFFADGFESGDTSAWTLTVP
ncbi:MAG: FG-GAP repeat protein [Deltaproteobacteria bacterium]|nr:FG-GAP repeat protein [Deltaproteobacteria bacterium]